MKTKLSELKAKRLPVLKRLLLNTLSIAVIGAVGFAAFRFYQSGEDTASGATNLPSLTVLKPVPGGLVINEKRKEIGIAFEISQNLTSYDDIAADVVKVYRWGRERFSPLLCGPLAPPNLCVDGRVLIYLVVHYQDPLTDARIKVMGMWLDQRYIDVLLVDQPETLDDLGAFHEYAYKDSLGTGAYLASEFTNPIFQYKNLTDFSLR